MAAGSRRRIAHVTEASLGVPSGTTYKIDRALADAGIDVDRSSFVSNEFRSDRAIGGHKLGVKRPKASLPFELSYSSFDDYIESAMCDAWAAAGTASSALTVTVVAGVTNTMAATGIGTGLVAGDWIKVSGFAAGLVGNNGFWKVTVATANLITLGEAVGPSGSMLTAGASGATVIVQKMGSIKTGTTIKSLSVEEGFTDSAVYMLARGVLVDTFELAMQPDSIITGSFGMVAKELAPDSPKATEYGVSYTPADTRPKIDTFSGFLRIDGVVVGVFSGGSLQLRNGVEAFFPLFQTSAAFMGLGRSDLTGSVSVYLTDAAYLTKYLAETPIALSFQLMESDGSRGYAVDIPVAKLNAPSKAVTENNVVLNMPFQALPDSVSGLVNWKWAKLA